jgi:hypothetical protein
MLYGHVISQNLICHTHDEEQDIGSVLELVKLTNWDDKSKPS